MKERTKCQRQEEFGTDFEEKVLYINRCSKVVKGGRKFSFSALILVGDGEGHVGFGFAKANEVADAIRKGSEAARKNIISFEREGTTIPHEVCVDWDGCRVLLKPASEGTGIIAGSKVRSVLELGGVKNVVAKNFGSNNPINQARATLKALSQLKNRKECSARRGIE
ncbi:MAG: 30S ribosomal protein S5 [Chlamydiae bacterium GWC2_50_10]|uniref:Small ribosomal subunit protein uS5 n=1 Tax=uncultured Chlamydiae bacterium Rifle_16ft_4_minimus_1822 TaxID=1665093 RepID=A0A0H4T1C5_9BACT|nr:30S ribosomal protein S5, small subunit ribosomal protein S5 [uncultured Chlamydiae bacterium Rifle_16ft_4_minimus_1822]OGN52646.1 MAG: 30S ribosomal protein S5 [Chlamydiae bacterium GWA2_50_15]OGN54497.1 MAG: 30S ribosomal protein S5 [Chlamydiae bacterium GWC2_50_10]OGN57909.1 MAG: 30S ribosomal protein S5 [Chlamydiae bacterium RIFCSPHIGHO2_02_FULL_49_29]OGN63532.1 MAG: 30S ribosomal protein S5 [Chlamydiae bacterium RIFCSPHIGHO2_12_FULL_49_32]OGN68361.1 MAG: 30S ribosomal protein S5 [Chlam